MTIGWIIPDQIIHRTIEYSGKLFLHIIRYSADVPVFITADRSLCHTDSGCEFIHIHAGILPVFSDRSAEVIASEYGISRSYVYDLKKQAEEVLDYFVMTETSPLPIVVFDDNQIKKAVLSLSMNCGLSLEGIQRHINDVYGLHVSIGKISEIITEASIKADDYLKEIDVSSIKQTANDEIFQGNQPILTSVDLESTYIINMCLCDDRSGASWETLMNDRKKQGLNPEISRCFSR